MELKELYQEIILDHGKNPRNKGVCKNYSHEAKGHNPLCGDKVHIFAKIDKDKNILDLSFEGEGCAISLASASILTDTLKGKDLVLTKSITKSFLEMIKSKTKISLNSLILLIIAENIFLLLVKHFLYQLFYHTSDLKKEL